MPFTTSRLWFPQVLAALLLLLGVGVGNLYGYYVLLRWICCPIFAYLGLVAHAEDRNNWAGPMGILALLYNPIFPLALGHELWIVINLATTALTLASILVLKKMPRDEDE
jgi:hypothetical protein